MYLLNYFFQVRLWSVALSLIFVKKADCIVKKNLLRILQPELNKMLKFVLACSGIKLVTQQTVHDSYSCEIKFSKLLFKHWGCLLFCQVWVTAHLFTTPAVAKNARQMFFAVNTARKRGVVDNETYRGMLGVWAAEISDTQKMDFSGFIRKDTATGVRANVK